MNMLRHNKKKAEDEQNLYSLILNEYLEIPEDKEGIPAPEGQQKRHKRKHHRHNKHKKLFKHLRNMHKTHIGHKFL